MKVHILLTIPNLFIGLKFFIFRLLIQLDETKKRFEEYWERHYKKLQQSLQLRRFEEDFKLVNGLYMSVILLN